MLENDYFLAALKDDFVENARLFIFETYCRIHQCIDMRMLAGDTLLTMTTSIPVLCGDCFSVCIPEQNHPFRIRAYIGASDHVYQLIHQVQCLL